MIKNIFRSAFAKSLSVYVISSYLNKAIAFLLMPLLTSYLSTEEYGSVAMFSALSSIIVAFIGWSMDGAILRKYYDDKEELDKVLFNYLLLLLISTLSITILFLAFSQPISMFSGVPSKYFDLCITCSAFSIVCNIVNCVYQAEDKPIQYSVFTNGWTLLNAVLSICFVVNLQMGLAGRLYGITISATIFGIIGFLVLKHDIGFKHKFSLEIIREELVVFGLPSLPMNLRGTILDYTDKLFVANLVSLSAAGVYTVGNQLALVIDVFVRSVSMAFTPWMYRKMDDNSQQSRRKVFKLVVLLAGVMLLIGVIWFFCAQGVLKFLIKKNYYGASAYLIWLIGSKVLTGFQLLIVNYIYYSKKTKPYAFISCITIILNIVLNYFLMNMLGTIGAAIATFLVCLFAFILTLLYVFKICHSLEY